MDFLTKEWFSLPIWAWLLIAVVIVALIIILVVVSIRSKNSAKNEEEYVDYDENAYIAKNEDDLAATSEEEKASVSPVIIEEKAEAKAETKPADKKEVKAETKPETKSAEKKEVKAEAKAETKAETKSAEKAEAETPEKPQRPTTKTYHISKRKDDGKWQVKMSKGAKAIKLFATQAEAIEYAKKLAENQDATIMIHKVDGSFRRLNYSSKK